MLFLILCELIYSKKNDKNIFWVSETNVSEYFHRFHSVLLLVQQGKDQRYRIFSDFISAANQISNRCYFAIMDGDRNPNYLKNIGHVGTRGYYFFRNGKYITKYNGKGSPDDIYAFVMEKTGVAFKTLEDFSSTQEFVDSNPYSVILFGKTAGGTVFELFSKISLNLRDKFSFGFCPDPDSSYEFRIRNVPSIVLFRKEDKSKIIFRDLTNLSTETEISNWIFNNTTPEYEVFQLRNIHKYKESKPTALLFAPVEEENREIVLHVLSMLAKKYSGSLRFAYIDAVSGNRFMQSLGFSRFADPAFAILDFSQNITYKYLYNESSPFNFKSVCSYIDLYMNGLIKPSIKCSRSQILHNESVPDINCNFMNQSIVQNNRHTFLLYYEAWDQIYQTMFPLYENLSLYHNHYRFFKMDISKNEILFGPEPKRTPAVIHFSGNNTHIHVFKKAEDLRKFIENFTNNSEL